MSPKLPIGLSDFRQVREGGFYYVDKTALVVEVLEIDAQVVLLPRPRRFGKTLNLSMLRCFLERSSEDLSPLFSDLSVWRATAARQHFQRYPVIFLTLKDVKHSSFADCLEKMKELIAALYREHEPALSSLALSSDERERIGRLLDGTASEVAYQGALGRLSAYLVQAHRERVIMLIDEYDTPIYAGFMGGYYDRAVEFFRNFLSGGLKDNPHLFKGVMTGILRVARENVFSGLNNISVHSLLDREFATAFGFTETEVEALTDALGRRDVMEPLRRWYNGYHFGGQVIYNPWSVLNFARSPDTGPKPYWVFTSSEDVLRQLVLGRGQEVLGAFEALLQGETVRQRISEHIALRDDAEGADAVWSLLLFSGYLTARSARLEEGRWYADLSIPNAELRYVFEESITSWVASGLGGGERLAGMLKAMLAGESEIFEQRLSELVLRTFSYHDAGGSEPERVYQAFVLGMLVLLMPEYEVRSNRESGLGRCDVMVLPRKPGRPGVVLELKEAGGATAEVVERALGAALQQIEAKGYAEELRARGAAPILGYGVVFDGKRVWVRKG
jgi:hypothetical protein